MQNIFAQSYFWLTVIIVVAGLFTAFASRLFMAVIWLAITSALVAYAMWCMDAPLAAVIELSVCAGLIPAVFILAVGFTSRLNAEQLLDRQREMLSRYWLLPLVLIVAVIILSQVHLILPAAHTAQTAIPSVREMMWNVRKADLIGQVIAILAGVFGVVVLLTWERSKK